MEFSEQVLNKAIKSINGELAWKKENVFLAIDELIKNSFAILGGDVWAIMKKEEDTLVLTHIDYKNIAVGIIKGKDGNDYVFNWHSDKRIGETWDEYVNRSKTETINSINLMNAEESVAQGLENSIYYNLVFADEIEYGKLEYSGQ